MNSTQGIGRARRRRVVRLLAVALLAALVGQPSTAQLDDAASVGIKNFGKVNDNYYRGSQPREAHLAALRRLGVKTIIDLRKDSEKGAGQRAQEAGLRYFNIPLTTKRPATEEQTAEFLRLVNDPENWPVYVHCAGGRHRTGQMTAILRITRDGWTADEAYAEMKRYDFEDSFFYPRSLKRYVFDFYKRHAQGNASRAVPAGQALRTAQ
jgi:tyrosine-protein phosphatase SIW14